MKLELFDLNLLRTLDVLLREHNITRTAERLNVTQQAVSGALRRLREQFDDELLVRSGRIMRLTPHAEALIEPVRAAMRQIDQALLTRPGFEAECSHRRFTISMSDYATLTILPTVMARLGATAPSIVLDVQLISETSVEEIEFGDVDLCLLPNDWSLSATNGHGTCAPKHCMTTTSFVS